MTLTAAEIEQKLQGIRLPARRFRPLYFLALVVTALVILSLVAFYFSLVLGSAAATVYAAIHYWGWFEDELSPRGWITMVLCYPIVLFTGGNITFLLLKPFLARQYEEDFCYKVRRGSHPAFDALVNGIAKQLGMRPPTEISVTSQVNASASLGGGWRAIFGRDLKLMVGLPLVSNLTVSQLGGVIAHEYGHFSQRIGMRLSLLITVVTHWFYRAAFSRDRWDAWLEARMGRSGGFDSTMIVRLCNAVRFVLRTLAKVAQYVSSFTGRQMEFDADVPEIEFAGSASFEETSFRFAEISYAEDVALSNCRIFWQERRLPEDFPSFTAATLAKVPEARLAGVREAVLKEKAAWFHSHPSPSQRISKARKRKAAGLVHIDAPATALFGNYQELAKLVTHNFYDVGLQVEVFSENLVPNSKFESDKDRRLNDQKLFRSFYGDGISMLFPIAFDTTHAESATATHELWARLVELGNRLAEVREAQAKAFHTFFKTHAETFVTLRQASLYVAANVSIEPEKFGIRKAIPMVITEARSAAYQEARPAIQAITRNNQCHAEIFYTVVNLLARPEVCPLNPAGLRAAFEESWALVNVLEGFQRAEGPLRELHYEYIAIGRIMEFIFSRKDVSENFGARLENAAKKVSKRLQEARGKVIAAFRKVPYPFEHANGTVTVAEYAGLVSAQIEDLASASPFQKAGFEYDLTQTVLDRIATLYRRILERMAFFSENIEKLRPAERTLTPDPQTGEAALSV